ncbi:hypothetical protein GW17_00033578 [Ensete ventricosum]|nr:hypothetical protein GW17_00033578 [Ensete ventricosum]
MQARQTALFTATQTKQVCNFLIIVILMPVLLSYKFDDSGCCQVTVEGLQQGYCVVPSNKRFLVLYAFLKRNLSKKIMVFFSSCNSVKYHSELLRYIQIDCFDIHGKQKQQKRTATFFDFCKAQKGILLCTDVAARGLDIPAVEKIVGENYFLSQSAKDAYRSYILAYNSHSMKNVFNVHHLNLKVSINLMLIAYVAT